MVITDKLPRVILDGTLFEIDYQKKQFIQSENPENTIRFSRLEPRGDYWMLAYDAGKQTAASLTDMRNPHYQIKPIHINAEILSSPQSVLDQAGFCKTHNQQSYESRHNILLIDEQIASRLSGKLPVINIAGHPYYVDLRMRAIRAHDHFDKTIEFREMYHLDQGRLMFVYRPKEMTLVPFPHLSKDYPENAIGVYLPPEQQMDPIRFATLQGLEETSLLPRFPQSNQLKAELRPLQQTWLAADLKQAQKNRENKSQAQPQKTPARKPKKGKSL